MGSRLDMIFTLVERATLLAERNPIKQALQAPESRIRVPYSGQRKRNLKPGTDLQIRGRGCHAREDKAVLEACLQLAYV
jgi:hypothetical protein